VTAPTPAGAVRRARALTACGWAPQTIERTAGIPAECRRVLENKHVIRPEVAQQIAAAYDRPWDKPPPQATDADRQRAEAAVRYAHIRGWAPPAVWDDDLIDLPDAKPGRWKRGGEKQRHYADLVEDIAFVREYGGYRHAPMSQIALRLGVSKDALDKAVSVVRHREAALDRGAG
jgi:hypothetical protein